MGRHDMTKDSRLSQGTTHDTAFTETWEVGKYHDFLTKAVKEAADKTIPEKPPQIKQSYISKHTWEQIEKANNNRQK